MRGEIKVGRPSMLEERNLSEKDFIALYHDAKSNRALAEALDCHPITIYRLCKQLDLPTKRKVKRDHSKFAQWLRENPGIKLPRSVKGICDITGLNKDIINSYLTYRQNKVYRYVIQNYKKYIAKQGRFVDKKGIIIPLKAIKRIKLTIDRYDDRIEVLAYVKNGRVYKSIETVEKIKEALGD